MRNILIPLAISSLFLFLSIASFSQDASPEHTQFTNAVGIRIGPTSPTIQNGISFKHFFNSSNAVEGILSLTNGFGVCGLYEIHKPLPVENLQWLIGAGAYVGFSNNTNYFGGAGIIGLDYNFPTLPLNLTIDWKPELNLSPRIFPEGSGVGFSARYTF